MVPNWKFVALIASVYEPRSIVMRLALSMETMTAPG